MSKKLAIVLLSLTLLQAPVAQAGFFDFFKSIGLAFSNIFRSSTPARVTVPEYKTNVSLEDTDWSPSSVLGDDPNDYQASVKVDSAPTKAECNSPYIGHRCGYLENDQVVASTCVNPVAVKSGSKSNSSGVKSNN